MDTWRGYFFEAVKGNAWRHVLIWGGAGGLGGGWGMVPAGYHHPRHIQGAGATWQLCGDHYGVDSRHRAELAGGIRGSLRG